MRIEAELAAKRREEEKRERMLRGESEDAEVEAAPEEKIVKPDVVIPSPSGIVVPNKPVEVKPAKVQAAPAATQPSNNGITISPKTHSKTLHHAVVEEVAKEKGGKLKLRGGDDRRSSGKITVNQALSNIEEQRVRSLASSAAPAKKPSKKLWAKARIVKRSCVMW